jgi:hypothetical protein
VAHDKLLHLGEGALCGWKDYQQKVTCAFSVAAGLSYRATGGASTARLRRFNRLAYLEKE